jgi:hypothetical protein
LELNYLWRPKEDSKMIWWLTVAESLESNKVNSSDLLLSLVKHSAHSSKSERARHRSLISINYVISNMITLNSLSFPCHTQSSFFLVD